MKAKARRLSEKDFPPLSPTTRRLIGKRPPRRHFLIVCEGEVTEPAYFEELRNRLPPEMVERIVLQGVGRGTTQLLKETDQRNRGIGRAAQIRQQASLLLRLACL